MRGPGTTGILSAPELFIFHRPPQTRRKAGPRLDQGVPPPRGHGAGTQPRCADLNREATPTCFILTVAPNEKRRYRAHVFIPTLR